MGANSDALDIDLVARQGLEKLGYTQEMTRVRTIKLLGPAGIDDASIRRPEACSISFSVSSIRQLVSRFRIHCHCCCSPAVSLGSFDTTAGFAQQLTSPSTQLSWQSVSCGLFL